MPHRLIERQRNAEEATSITLPPSNKDLRAPLSFNISFHQPTTHLQTLSHLSSNRQISEIEQEDRSQDRTNANMDQMMGGGDGGMGGQAGFPLEQWFWEMPLCTRWWTTATVLTSALVQCQIVTPFQLFYSFRAVFSKSQVSRDPSLTFRQPRISSDLYLFVSISYFLFSYLSLSLR